MAKYLYAISNVKDEMDSVVLGCKKGSINFSHLTHPLCSDAKWKSKRIGVIKHHKVHSIYHHGNSNMQEQIRQASFQ